MQETTCPMCGGGFVAAWGAAGAPHDGFTEKYCSEECRDRAQEQESRRRAYPGHWMPPEPFPWDGLEDPFAE